MGDAGMLGRVVDLPAACVPELAPSLSGALDTEGKLLRALDALGPLSGRRAAVLDVPGTPWVDRLRAAGTEPMLIPAGEPGSALRIDAADGSLDALVTLWTGFRGVAPADLAEADRVLASSGRLLVVHDYGRDDVSALRDPGAPEYTIWSRREGPFLRDNGFKIRVVHCFWTFASLEAAAAALEPFAERGAAVAARLKRPRLAWNVAVYHRWRGGEAPAEPEADA
jgi:hypothetical protein